MKTKIITLSIFLIINLGFRALFAQDLNWIVEPKYDCATVYTEFDHCAWLFYDDQSSELINKNGDVVVKKGYYSKIDFIKDVNLVSFVDSEQKSHYYTKDFKDLSEKYDNVRKESAFHTLLTYIDDKIGMIDAAGVELIPNKYASLRRITTTQVEAINDNGKKKVITIPSLKSSNVFKTWKYENNVVYEDCYLDTKTNKIFKTIGIKAGDKTILSPDKYFSKDKLYGPLVDSLYIISDIETGLLGVVNYRGQVVMEPQATKLQSTNVPHLYNAIIDNKKTVFDIQKQELITHEDEISVFFKAPYLMVSKDKKKGLLDLNGKELIPKIFDGIDYNESYFSLVRGDSPEFNKKSGIYDIEKDSIVNLKCNFISTPEKVLRLNIGKKYAFYDARTFEMISDTIYDKIDIVSKKYYEGTERLWKVIKYKHEGEEKERKVRDNNYTYFDRLGNTVYGPSKKRLKSLYNDIFVYRDSMMHFINIETEEIYSIEKREYEKKDEVIIFDKTDYFFVEDFFNKKEKATKYQNLKNETTFDLDKRRRLYTTQKDDLYGFVLDGETITKPIFEKIRYHTKNKTCSVLYKGKSGLLKVY